MGWWGTVLLGGVLATTYGALYFTYVYVRVASADWPPAGILPPALGLPSLSALALAASAACMRWAARHETTGALAAYRAGVILTAGLGAAHAGLLLAGWAGQPFGVSDHAYGSLYYVLPGIHLVILGIGLLIALVLLALSWHPEGRATLHVGTRSLAFYWYLAAIGGVVLLAVVSLLPYLWQGAIEPP